MTPPTQLTGKTVNNCIAVIGDGAITGGMAYEAMNCAGYLKQRMIVVLNDNGQVLIVMCHHVTTATACAGTRTNNAYTPVHTPADRMYATVCICAYTCVSLHARLALS